MKIGFTFFWGVALLLATSCSRYAGSFKSNNTPGQINESFSNFNTTDAVKLKVAAGDILFVCYGLQLKQGRFQLSVLHGKKVLWNKKISAENDSSNYQFTIKEVGEYTIETSGVHAEGALTLHYKTVAPKNIAVAINANLELFGLMMQLDLGPDIAQMKDSVLIENRKSTYHDWYLLADSNYHRYKAFDSCAMMQLWRRYRDTHHYDDFFISFLEQVDEVPLAKLNEHTENRNILSFSEKGELEDARKNATAFLDAFNHFYTMIHFDNYLQENKTNHERIKADVSKNLPVSSFVPVMENFYNKHFNNYYLLPVLNIPTSQGYGSMNNNTQTIYNAFGPFSFQSFNANHIDLGFDYRDRISGLSIHEFGHSFVNPAISALPTALIQATAYLYQPIKEAMSKKAYTDWQSCLNEHFVRAGEVMIARQLGDSTAAEKKLQGNVDAKFIYLPFIVHQLELYERDLNPDKNYNAFVTVVMQRLKDANPQ
jgi:hypothetical protein